MTSGKDKDFGKMSSEEEEMLIRLESSTHVSSLTKRLEEQFLNESMVDVVLVTEEGKFIHAHKFILSAGSLYFKNIIENAGRVPFPHNSSFPMIICLSSVKYKHLYPLIKYVYTGRVDIPQNDLKVLVKTAFQLKISGLYEEGEDKDLDPSCFQKRGDLDGEVFADGESNDLSIEAFIKEEQEGAGYDCADMEDEVESNEPDSDSMTYTGGPSNFHDGLFKASPDIKVTTEEDSAFPPYPYPPPPMTQGHSSLSSSHNVAGNPAIRRRWRKQDSSFPYHCQACGSGYKCSKSLWRHRKYNCPATESVNKVTFVCKICTKAFSRADNLKRHTMLAHNIDDKSEPV